MKGRTLYLDTDGRCEIVAPYSKMDAEASRELHRRRHAIETEGVAIEEDDDPPELGPEFFEDPILALPGQNLVEEVARVRHPRSCHCGGSECAPCRHHPGEDCSCYCRFLGECTSGTCGGAE